VNLAATRRAALATRELLQADPETFSLPLGLVETGDCRQLLTVAALLVEWVKKRERCTAGVAIKLLGGDYVFDALLSAAAEREQRPEVSA
jgi:hypothetical protein